MTALMATLLLAIAKAGAASYDTGSVWVDHPINQAFKGQTARALAARGLVVFKDVRKGSYTTMGRFGRGPQRTHHTYEATIVLTQAGHDAAASLRP